MLELAWATLTSTNPGIVLIVAAAATPLVRGTPARAAALVGGPLVGLLALLYAPDFGADMGGMALLGFNLSPYRPDSVSWIFGFGFLIAAALAGVYRLHREDRLQDFATLAYAGAATGAVFAGDLLTLVIFWELVTLTSVILILARRTRAAQAAATRYFIIQAASGLALIAGAALHASGGGGLLFSDMAQPGELLIGIFDLSRPGGWLIFVAAGIKAGFPLVHNWLTDAYPNATEEGAVALSAFTTTLGVYLLMRGFAGTPLLIWIGAAMTVYPVFFAVVENDLRKVLAYSSNNQMGFMVCAVGIGGPLAINGAAAHAVAHIVFKMLLFMSMGAVMLRTGTTKASELGGLHRSMPFTALMCLIGAFSIAGLPLSAAFASKSLIMSAVEQGGASYVVWLMLLFASAGVLEHSGIKIPYFAFFGHDSGLRPTEAPFSMLLAMGVAATLCVMIGFSPAWFYDLLPYRSAAEAYLARDLWSPQHILIQAELLAFAMLAFLVLKRTNTYPAERAGVIIDVEWLWRAGWPRLLRFLRRAFGSIGEAGAGALFALWEGVIFVLQQAFAPDRAVSRRFPFAQTAVWIVGILTLALFTSLTAVR